MKIIALSGSLKSNSLNSMLLNATEEYFPAGTEYRLLSTDLPLYNEELEGDAMPKVIRQFKEEIASAEAVLMASPEYNHSFSGVLKNAIDWASRPAFESPLKGKPIALLSASMSPLGGTRGQAQLRPVLASTLSEAYPAIEYLLGGAHEAFDDNSILIDETAARRLERFINGFVEWANKGDKQDE